MTTQIVHLNGASSSGKTTIARELQVILTPPWIRVGVDDLLEALPTPLLDSESGLRFGPDGEISVGQGFREIEAAWMAGVAAMARAGARVIVEDVFLDGASSQRRTRGHLEGLEVLWVGVRCDSAVATERERARGDRMPGMAALQAAVVHEGVDYDLEVDTTVASPADCAKAIAARIA